MSKKIASNATWLARSVAALAGLAVMLAVALVGTIVMLAVVFGMFVLPLREPSSERSSGKPANSWPGLLRPRPR